jgi:hypothetical protein
MSLKRLDCVSTVYIFAQTLFKGIETFWGCDVVARTLGFVPTVAYPTPLRPTILSLILLCCAKAMKPQGECSHCSLNARLTDDRTRLTSLCFSRHYGPSEQRYQRDASAQLFASASLHPRYYRYRFITKLYIVYIEHRVQNLRLLMVW